MNFTLSDRGPLLGVLGLVGVLTLGCGDPSRETENPATSGGNSSGATSGAASGASYGGGSSAGSAATPTAGESASAALAGGGPGGSATGGSGGAAGNGGGGAGGASGGGGGGVTVDPTGGAPAGPSSGRQTARPLGSVAGTTQGYWEYLPPHYGNGALYPLLWFGHGSGENGDGSLQGLQKVLTHGPPKLIKADQWPDARTFVVLSPQHNPAGAGQCPSSKDIDDFLTFAMGKYAIDPKHVYLTGLSCGANATWNYLGDHVNEKVAAVVTIAGDARGAFQKQGCKLGAMPLWAFHGLADMAESSSWEVDPINSLNMCSPPPVDAKVTTYPGVPHDAWTMTYDLSNPANDIYAWMMKYSHQ